LSAALATGSGPLQGTASISAVAGVATFTNLADNKAESITLKFTDTGLTGVTDTTTIVISAAAANKLVMKTEPSATATAGVAFATQPAVYVEDTFGNVVTTDTSTIVAALATGSGPLQGTASISAVAGVATFTNLADNKAESITLKFSDGALTGVTDTTTIVISAAAANKLVMKTEPSATATAGVAFGTQPAVYVEDTFGNVVTTDTSTIAAVLATGSGPLQGTASISAVAGVATFTNLADNKAESITLKFTDTGLTGVTDTTTIVISAAAANKLVMKTEPSATATAGVAFGTQPAVYVEDTFGNVVTTDTSTIAAVLATGSGPLQGTASISAVAGVATFTNLADNKAESITLKFTDTGLTGVTDTTTIVISAAAANKLVMKTEPSATATAGVAFATQPAVYVEDTFGNVVTTDTSTIAAVLATGSGPLQGTASISAVAGVATFTNLADNKAESITLKFSDGALTGVTDTTTIVISAAAANKLVMKTEPSATATAGVAFATQPAVYVEDTFGNVVTTDTSTIAAVLATGSGPLQGTASISAVAGVATFTNLADNKAESITLKFSDTGL
jgi:uncharacterized protein YunC (DUF1805 family)